MRTAEMENRPTMEAVSDDLAGGLIFDNSTAERSTEPFTMLPTWVLREGLLTPIELSVYMVLLSHRDEHTGRAWPSFDTIARQARISRRTAIRAVRDLEARKIIRVTKRSKSSGDNDSNLYIVARFPRAASSSGVTESLPSAPLSPPSDTESPGGSDSQSPKEEPLSTTTTEEESAFFANAWKYWPRKEKRLDAVAAFPEAAAKYGSAEGLQLEIIRHGSAYAATTERPFVPQLAGWLAAERWTDDLPTAPSKKLTPFERAVETFALYQQEPTAAATAPFRIQSDKQTIAIPPPGARCNSGHPLQPLTPGYCTEAHPIQGALTA